MHPVKSGLSYQFFINLLKITRIPAFPPPFEVASRVYTGLNTLKVTVLYDSRQDELGEFEIIENRCAINQLFLCQFMSGNPQSQSKIHFYIDQTSSAGLAGHVAIDLKEGHLEDDLSAQLQVKTSNKKSREPSLSKSYLQPATRACNLNLRFNREYTVLQLFIEGEEEIYVKYPLYGSASYSRHVPMLKMTLRCVFVGSVRRNIEADPYATMLQQPSLGIPLRENRNSSALNLCYKDVEDKLPGSRLETNLKSVYMLMLEGSVFKIDLRPSSLSSHVDCLLRNSGEALGKPCSTCSLCCKRAEPIKVLRQTCPSNDLNLPQNLFPLELSDKTVQKDKDNELTSMRRSPILRKLFWMTILIGGSYFGAHSTNMIRREKSPAGRWLKIRQAAFLGTLKD